MIWKCIYRLHYRVISDWTCQRSLLAAPKYVIKYQYLVFVCLFTSTHRACNFRKWRNENKQKYIHWILLRNHNGTDQAQINNNLQNKKQSQMTRMYVRVLRAEQLFPCLRPTNARLLPSWERVLGTSTPGLSPTYVISQLPSHYTLRTP